MIGKNFDYFYTLLFITVTNYIFYFLNCQAIIPLKPLLKKEIHRLPYISYYSNIYFTI